MVISSSKFKYFRAIINAVILIIILLFTYNYRAEFAILLTIRWQSMATLLSVSFLQTFVASAVFANLFQPFGAMLHIFESFGLANIVSTLNFTLPGQAGAVARAIYLKQKYAVPYSQTPAIILGSLIISLFVSSFIMATSIIAILWLGISVPVILWVSTILSFSSILLLWFSIPKSISNRLGRVGKWIELFSNGWHSLRNDKLAFVKMCFFQFVLFLVTGVGFTLAFRSLGQPLNIFEGISLAVFSSFASLINITPGNIGIKEAIVGFFSVQFGIPFTDGFIAFALWRVINMTGYFLLAPVAWYILFHRQEIGLQLSNSDNS